MPYDADGIWYEDFTSGGYDDDYNYVENSNPYDDPSRQLDLDYSDPSLQDVGVITNPDGSLSGGSGIGAGSAGGASGVTSNVWREAAKKFLGAAATPAGIASMATALYGLSGANKPTTGGWKGTVDPNKYTYNRPKLEQPAYTPYSGSSAPVMGRQSFGPGTYTQGIATAPATTAPATTAPTAPAATAPVTEEVISGAAAGGLMGLAAGGSTKKPRYLQGATDGMADKLATNIDGGQAAALSHGEFVIPADVVSHLGNGNSEAGAQQLYKMMDRIRVARTGKKEQGKRINPDKFTPGGIAGYAGGGVVAFTPGGAVTTGQGNSTSMPVTSESNLSSWAGPGIASYIERGTALANSPYQAYTGPLSAGTSPLQQQAFGAAANLQTPASMGQGASMIGAAGNAMGNLSYNPTAATNQFTAPAAYQTGNFQTGTFDAGAAQQYMNPYMQASLNPQIEEARRQSEITQAGNASRLSQAGAYGGSRGALMQSEAQRNLGSNLANITGQGYNTAYTNAMQQFNADQTRRMEAQRDTEASRQFGASQGMTAAQNTAQYGQQAQNQNMLEQQFGANFGLSGLRGQIEAGTALGGLGAQQNAAGIANLNALMGAGTTQRGIEQQGIDESRRQYEEERLDPYAQIRFVQSLYQGLPTSTVTGSTATTPVQDLSNVAYGAGSVYDAVNRILNPTTPAAT